MSTVLKKWENIQNDTLSDPLLTRQRSCPEHTGTSVVLSIKEFL